MEIHSQNEVLKVALPKGEEKARRRTDKGFGAILDRAMEDSPKADGEVGRAPVVDTLAGIRFSSRFSAVETTAIIQRTEKLLDILDEYRGKLHDLDVDPKEISPLIKEMEMKNQALDSALNSLDREDGLRGIVKEAMITSSMEIARFNRGDYRVV